MNQLEEQKRYLLKKRITRRAMQGLLLISLLSLVVVFVIKAKDNAKKSFFINLIAANLLDLEVKPAIISGISKTGMKYFITSKTIENYIANFFYKKNIYFFQPIINLETIDKKKIQVKSNKGEYNEEEKLFYLRDRVEVSSREGAYFESSEIIMDLRTSKVYTNKPVIGHSDGYYVYFNGFSLTDNFESLNLEKPIKISDKKINTKQLLSDRAIYKSFYFMATGNIIINDKKKKIVSDLPFLIFKDGIDISADSFNIDYIKLGEMNDLNNLSKNFNRIEAKGNFRAMNMEDSSVLKGDIYIFDVKKGVMIVKMNSGDTTYEGDRYSVYARDRFEFIVKEHIAVARGRPRILAKNSAGLVNYEIQADLAYLKLDNENKNILYAEIFDKIVIKAKDNSKIVANYGYLDYEEDILYLEEDLKLYNYDGSVLEGCKIIINIKDSSSRLVPCEDQKKFNTKFKIKKETTSKEEVKNAE